MKEYIEREALLRDIEEAVVFTAQPGKPSPEMRGANQVIDRIKAAKTADVVEVVRCGQCVNWDKAGFCHHPTGMSYYGERAAAHGFCYFGDRRDANG